MLEVKERRGKMERRERETLERFSRQLIGMVETSDNKTVRESVSHLESIDVVYDLDKSEMITSDDFNVDAVISKGGCEGWWCDVYISGCWNQDAPDKAERKRIITCKTLEEDLCGALTVGTLAGAFMQYGIDLWWDNNKKYITDKEWDAYMASRHIKYKIYETHEEVPYKYAKGRITQGCTGLCESPILLGTFTNKAKANAVFDKLKSKVEYMEGNMHPYFIVTEYRMETVECNADGEFAKLIDCDISDGDYTNRYLN